MRVSGVINCCYEGLLLKKSIDSALLSIEASGFSKQCELVVVADSANDATARALADYREQSVRVVSTDVSDLGLARNIGANAAQGELILFLDGDDLWCQNWVGEAWAAYLVSPTLSVLHSQFCIVFGAQSEILVHPDWRDPYFSPRGLVARNYWVSTCGVRRELLAEHPFPATDRKRRFGFEDWSWYAETVARGFRHVAVPFTTHFIRRKAVGSLLNASRRYLRIPSVAFSDYLATDDRTRPCDL